MAKHTQTICQQFAEGLLPEGDITIKNNVIFIPRIFP